MTRIAPQLSALAVPIDAVRPHPRNPNQGDVGSITTSLEQLAQYAPIVVQRSTGHIVKGNHTYLAARALGWTEIAANVMDLDDTQALAVLVGDNRHSELGTRDQDALGELLTELAQADALLGTGYDGDDVDALLAELLDSTKGQTDPDAVPGVPDEPITKPGDLWVLGRHRLLCGDSTVATDVERLMGGKKAQMVFTDPPYGVDYQGGQNAVKRDRLANDDRDIYTEALPMAYYASTDSAPLYLWFAGAVGEPAYTAVTAADYQVRALLVWHKLSAHYGAYMAQYMQKHEPFLYCFKRGHAPHWYGPTNEVTVWEHDQPSRNELHPTQKPVALAERALANSSKPGDIVLDPFLGSGTTLIAAEQLGRSCYGMEISPAYCDVIVQRWQDFTGQQAVRV